MRCSNLYSLPEFSFIGGESQELLFHLYDEQYFPIEIDDLIGVFSLVPYGHSLSKPIFTAQGTVTSDEYTGLMTVSVLLDAKDTVNFNGKYVYQMSLRDPKDNVELFQGLVNIYNNIHKEFVLVTKLG